MAVSDPFSRFFSSFLVPVWLALGILWGAVLNPGDLRAGCILERGGTGATAALTYRVSSTCTDSEREANAVPARDLLRALASGKGIDLVGVVIEGDLNFDELPAQKVEAVSDLSPEDREILGRLNADEVRVIRGPFVIKEARVRGRVVNRLKRGFLVMTGPVVLADTRFEGVLDLSRTVFFGLVDGSRATFEQESYFVQDRFTQGVMFQDAHFGPHARFHRSIFAGPAIFRGASFKGLTEFLEVDFVQSSNFSHATFHLGTGFSGAHCRDKCDFSFAQFDREAFFLYSRFDGPASFASARFESQVDFSDASFKEPDDLALATFIRPPLLTRSTRVTATMPGRPEASSTSQALTIALFVAALGILLYIIKSK